MKYTKGFLCCFFLIMLVLFCGCSNSAKSKKQIVNEIVENEPFFELYNLEPTKSTIEKRQTNPDKKDDFIWINIIAENDDFKYDVRYKVTYILYNDGWRLEDFEKIESCYTVISDVDRTNIENELAKEYLNYEFSKSENGVNSCSIIYTAQKEVEYKLNTYKVTYFYKFTPEKNWHEVDNTEVFVKSVDVTEERRTQIENNKNQGFLRSAKKAIEDGEFETALENLNKITKKDAEVNELFQKTYNELSIMYYQNGELDNSLKYINLIETKSEKISAIETEIIDFKSKYSKWLGGWGFDKKKVSTKVRAVWDNGLHLAIEDGKTTSGSIIIYDIYKENSNNVLTFHSDEFSVFNYQILTYISDGVLEYRTKSDHFGIDTSHKMYKINSDS